MNRGRSPLRRRASSGRPGPFSMAPFGRFIGIRVVSLKPGRCVLELDLKPHHHNPVGVVHGGALFTLMDTSMGGALRAARGGRSSVAIEIHTRYLEPVVRGKVRAEGRVVRLGKTLAVMESVAWQGERPATRPVHASKRGGRGPRGREVARATGSFYLL